MGPRCLAVLSSSRDALPVRGDLASARSRCEQVKKQGGAAGGGSSGNLRYLPARQSATKHRVDCLDAEREERRRRSAFERRKRARQGAIEFPFAKCCFKDGQGNIRHIFASADYRRK